MRKQIGLRWTVWVVAAAMLTVLVAACGETVVKEVPVEVVVEKEVVREVHVEVERVVEVEKEVVKEVVREVPVEVVKEVEVIKEVPKVITEEKVVVREIERIVVATPAPVGAAQFFMQALDPFPKRGGQLVLGAHGPPSHFDIYGSGTIANHGSQAAMYDALLRQDPRTHLTPIIPDLAYRWEISSDLQTFTFDLREGVKFHDGTDFTSADVKATYERILTPDVYQEGLVSVRGQFWPTLSGIATPDDHTVSFTFGEKVATENVMLLFSSEWNMINSKATLDKYEGNLRDVDNPPGTGPMMYVSRDEDQWIVEANPNYWNPNAPYVDGIKHVWLVAWTPENSAAILGGITDWTMWLAPKDGRDIGNNPGLNALRQNVPVWGGVSVNHNRPQFQDARVRQAFALVIDGRALIDSVKDIKGVQYGAVFINGTPYAERFKHELDTRPGLRRPTPEDVAEAQRLLADAGYPNGEGFPKLDILTRETPDDRTFKPLVQAMLKQHLNIDGEIRLADVSGIQQDVLAGNFDIGGAGSFATIPDPAIYLRNVFGKCGDPPEPCQGNTTGYDSAEFDALIEEFGNEFDLQKRLGIADRLWEHFMAEMPFIPTGASEIVYHGFWDHVKGTMPGDSDFYGAYELHKWDNVWLDR